jgi:tetratricopeptide (TPR) repeat protein
LRYARAAAKDHASSTVERAEMLMELAIGLQVRPKTPEHLKAAISLYEDALEICPRDERLLLARITARRATALQAMPGEDMGRLSDVRAAYEQAIPELKNSGTPEELAEVEMNLGLVVQELAAHGQAKLADAIAAYQRALATFNKQQFPAEFAILQNNLATAFLLLPMADERAKMREALAVQCFEEALKTVNLVEHPSEYAMLQNNLGNALQHSGTGHPVANLLRAVAAYDEALRIRSAATAPIEYANTLANKAACLCRLPDEPEQPHSGNRNNLTTAKSLYEQARQIFVQRGEMQRGDLVSDALAEIEESLGPPR